jgi:uncharacterized protein with HEPN domain
LQQRDASYLWDIVNTVRELQGFLAGKNTHDFATDKLLRRAVERDLGIIGEAARQVSSEFRDQHPEIPWSSVIGLRNVLAHEYGDVLVQRVWEIATTHAPELADSLEPLIPAIEDAS